MVPQPLYLERRLFPAGPCGLGCIQSVAGGTVDYLIPTTSVIPREVTLALHGRLVECSFRIHYSEPSWIL